MAEDLKKIMINWKQEMQAAKKQQAECSQYSETWQISLSDKIGHIMQKDVEEKK